MEPPSIAGLAALQTRLAQPPSWLNGAGAHNFDQAFAYARASLQQMHESGENAPGPVVVAQGQPAEFLAGVLAAIAEGETVALASPRWGAVERAQAGAQLRPGLWLGAGESRWLETNPEIKYDASAWTGSILIPTGGTGGCVRWAVHSWSTLAAAARSLDAFLGDGPFTHVSTLPPSHVSGLMPAVRAIETGGMLRLEEWKTLEAGTPPGITPDGAVISLVPTQLRRLLSQPTVMDWLRGTRAILLGGAKADDNLLDEARAQRLPICLAYGMTETAAVVAAQTPADFLAGEPPHVTPLPHANLWIGDDTGAPLLVGEPGRVWIEAESLFAGYFPNPRAPGPWATEDSGVLDAQGRLKILGRLDRVIVTGGEKVSPAEIERCIRASGLVKDVLVVGVPDAEWGERVTAIYTGAPRAEAELRAAIESLVAAHAMPKGWMNVERLPGKNEKFIHHEEREGHEGT